MLILIIIFFNINLNWPSKKGKLCQCTQNLKDVLHLLQGLTLIQKLSKTPSKNAQETFCQGLGHSMRPQ